MFLLDFHCHLSIWALSLCSCCAIEAAIGNRILAPKVEFEHHERDQLKTDIPSTTTRLLPHHDLRNLVSNNNTKLFSPSNNTSNFKMPGGKSSGGKGKSSGGKTGASGDKKQISHSAKAGLQVSSIFSAHPVHLLKTYQIMCAYEAIQGQPQYVPTHQSRLEHSEIYLRGPTTTRCCHRNTGLQNDRQTYRWTRSSTKYLRGRVIGHRPFGAPKTIIASEKT